MTEQTQNNSKFDPGDECRRKLYNRGIDPDQKIRKPTDHDEFLVMCNLAGLIGHTVFVEVDKFGLETGRYGLLRDGQVAVSAMSKAQLRRKLVLAVHRHIPRVGERHE